MLQHGVLENLQAPPPDQTLSEGSPSPAAASEQPSSNQPQHAQQAVSREEEEERRGLVCMVCKEGYASRPTELLAAYCYCMKLRTGEGFGAVPEVWNGPGPHRPNTLQVTPTATSHTGLVSSIAHPIQASGCGFKRVVIAALYCVKKQTRCGTFAFSLCITSLLCAFAVCQQA